jgi:hypothetical protein
MPWCLLIPLQEAIRFTVKVSGMKNLRYRKSCQTQRIHQSPEAFDRNDSLVGKI